MGRISRKSIFGVSRGKLICPDGREYELKDTIITVSNDFTEIPLDDSSGSPVVHCSLDFSLFYFGDKPWEE